MFVHCSSLCKFGAHGPLISITLRWIVWNDTEMWYVFLLSNCCFKVQRSIFTPCLLFDLVLEVNSHEQICVELFCFAHPCFYFVWPSYQYMYLSKYPSKMECSYLHGGVIENGHTRNPLTLRTVPVLVHVRLWVHILGVIITTLLVTSSYFEKTVWVVTVFAITLLEHENEHLISQLSANCVRAWLTAACI